MSSHNRNHHVVVLGGGITGLSAAFYLARKHPTVQITLVEKSTRFGGWVRSERVQVCDSHGNRARVLLEAGPRTIRPNAKSVLELIHLLDLRSEVIYTPRSSPAGRNRFLHVPPAEGLMPLPSGILSLFTLPLGRLVLRSVLAEPFVPANRPQKKTLPPPSPPSPPPPAPPTATTDTAAAVDNVEDEEDEDEDESVDSFFSRRFGDAFARTLGSALVHGIYAADSRQLSLRAAFPQLRASETRGKGSVIWGELGPPAWFATNTNTNTNTTESQQEVEAVGVEWETRLRRTAALFSFREGMETLVRGLVEALHGFPNVVLRSGTAVRGIGMIDTAGGGGGDDGDDHCSFRIYLNAEDGKGEGVPLRATHLISALPLPVLDSILQQPPAGGAEAAAGASTTHPSLPHLRTNPHSSVTVLNLVFPTSPPNKNDNSTGEQPTPASTPLHPPGFGYLIPRPEHGYPEPGREGEHEHEHEGEPGLGLLGVVFDTASLPEQDHDGENDAAGFTKMTAMLGGPYPCPNARDSSSSDAQLVAAVVRRISSQLGHALPPPVHYAVHRNAESIPTYLVGHTARMGQLGRALRERWSGRMKVVGAGVGGVSVADCVKAGRQAAFEVAAQMGN